MKARRSRQSLEEGNCRFYDADDGSSCAHVDACTAGDSRGYSPGVVAEVEVTQPGSRKGERNRRSQVQRSRKDPSLDAPSRLPPVPLDSDAAPTTPLRRGDVIAACMTVRRLSYLNLMSLIIGCNADNIQVWLTSCHDMYLGYGLYGIFTYV
jgi:hypothetical protein